MAYWDDRGGGDPCGSLCNTFNKLDLKPLSTLASYEDYIRKQLLLLEEDEGDPSKLYDAADMLRRYIEDVPKPLEDTIAFAKNINNKIRFLSEIASRNVALSRRFPNSRQLHLLLVRYIELEYEVLYSTPNPSPEYQRATEDQVVLLLSVVLKESASWRERDTLEEGIVEEICTMNSLHVILSVKDDYKRTGNFIERITDKLMKILDVFKDAGEVTSENGMYQVDQLRQAPKLQKLVEFMRRRDRQLDSSDVSEDEIEEADFDEIATPVKEEIPDVVEVEEEEKVEEKYKIKPFASCSTANKIMTIDLIDEDVSLVYFQPEVQKLNTNKDKQSVVSSLNNLQISERILSNNSDRNVPLNNVTTSTTCDNKQWNTSIHNNNSVFVVDDDSDSDLEIIEDSNSSIVNLETDSTISSGTESRETVEANGDVVISETGADLEEKKSDKIDEKESAINLETDSTISSANLEKQSEPIEVRDRLQSATNSELEDVLLQCDDISDNEIENEDEILNKFCEVHRKLNKDNDDLTDKNTNQIEEKKNEEESAQIIESSAQLISVTTANSSFFVATEESFINCPVLPLPPVVIEENVKETTEDVEAKQDESKTVQEEESRTVQEEESRTVQEEESKMVQEEEFSTVQEEESRMVQEEESGTVQEGECSTVQEEEAKTVQEEEFRTVQEEEFITVQEGECRTVQEESRTVQEEQSKTVQEEEFRTVQEKECRMVQEKESITVQVEESRTVQEGECRAVQEGECRAVQEEESRTVQEEEFRTVQVEVSRTVKEQDSRTVQEEESRTVQEEQTKTVQEEELRTVQEKESGTVQETESVTVQVEESRTVEEEESRTVQEGECRAVQEEESRTVQEEEFRTVQVDESRTVQDQDSRTVQEEESRTVQEEESRTVQEEQTNTVQEEEFRTVQEKESRTVQETESVTVQVEESRTVEEEESRTVQEGECRAVQEEEFSTVQVEESRTVQEQDSRIVQEKEIRTFQVEDSRPIQEGECRTVQEEESRTVQEEESKTVQEEEFRIVQEEESRTVQEEESKIVQEEESKTVQDESTTVQEEEFKTVQEEDKQNSAVCDNNCSTSPPVTYEPLTSPYEVVEFSAVFPTCSNNLDFLASVAAEQEKMENSIEVGRKGYRKTGRKIKPKKKRKSETTQVPRRVTRSSTAQLNYPPSQDHSKCIPSTFMNLENLVTPTPNRIYNLIPEIVTENEESLDEPFCLVRDEIVTKNPVFDEDTIEDGISLMSHVKPQSNNEVVVISIPESEKNFPGINYDILEQFVDTNNVIGEEEVVVESSIGTEDKETVEVNGDIVISETGAELEEKKSDKIEEEESAMVTPKKNRRKAVNKQTLVMPVKKRHVKYAMKEPEENVIAEPHKLIAKTVEIEEVPQSITEEYITDLPKMESAQLTLQNINLLHAESTRVESMADTTTIECITTESVTIMDHVTEMECNKAAECVAEPTIIEQCVLVEHDITELLPIESTNTEECVIENVITEPVTMEEYHRTIEECITEPLITIAIEKPAIMEECVGDSLVTEEFVNMEEHVPELASIEENVPEPATIEECVTQPATMEECVLESNSEECVTEPATLDECVLESVTSEECVTEAVSMEECVTEAVSMEECVTELTTTEKCVVETESNGECVLESATMEKCVEEPQIMNAAIEVSQFSVEKDVEKTKSTDCVTAPSIMIDTVQEEINSLATIDGVIEAIGEAPLTKHYDEPDHNEVPLIEEVVSTCDEDNNLSLLENSNKTIVEKEIYYDNYPLVASYEIEAFTEEVVESYSDVEVGKVTTKITEDKNRRFLTKAALKAFQNPYVQLQKLPDDYEYKRRKEQRSKSQDITLKQHKRDSRSLSESKHKKDEPTKKDKHNNEINQKEEASKTKTRSQKLDKIKPEKKNKEKVKIGKELQLFSVEDSKITYYDRRKSSKREENNRSKNEKKPLNHGRDKEEKCPEEISKKHPRHTVSISEPLEDLKSKKIEEIKKSTPEYKRRSSRSSSKASDLEDIIPEKKKPRIEKDKENLLKSENDLKDTENLKTKPSKTSKRRNSLRSNKNFKEIEEEHKKVPKKRKLSIDHNCEGESTYKKLILDECKTIFNSDLEKPAENIVETFNGEGRTLRKKKEVKSVLVATENCNEEPQGEDLKMKILGEELIADQEDLQTKKLQNVEDLKNSTGVETIEDQEDLIPKEEEPSAQNQEPKTQIVEMFEKKKEPQNKDSSKKNEEIPILNHKNDCQNDSPIEDLKNKKESRKKILVDTKNQNLKKRKKVLELRNKKESSRSQAPDTVTENCSSELEDLVPGNKKQSRMDLKLIDKTEILLQDLKEENRTIEVLEPRNKKESRKDVKLVEEAKSSKEEPNVLEDRNKKDSQKNLEETNELIKKDLALEVLESRNKKKSQKNVDDSKIDNLKKRERENCSIEQEALEPRNNEELQKGVKLVEETKSTEEGELKKKNENLANEQEDFEVLEPRKKKVTFLKNDEGTKNLPKKRSKIDALKKKETVTENCAIEQEDPKVLEPKNNKESQKGVKLVEETKSTEEELKKKNENLVQNCILIASEQNDLEVLEPRKKKESQKSVTLPKKRSKIDDLKKKETVIENCAIEQEDSEVLEPKNNKESQKGLKLVEESKSTEEIELKKKKKNLEENCILIATEQEVLEPRKKSVTLQAIKNLPKKRSKIDNLKKKETVTENCAIEQEDPKVLEPKNNKESQKGVKLVEETKSIKDKNENLPENCILIASEREDHEILEPRKKKASHKSATLHKSVEGTKNLPKKRSKIDDLKKKETVTENCAIEQEDSEILEPQNNKLVEETESTNDKNKNLAEKCILIAIEQEDREVLEPRKKKESQKSINIEETITFFEKSSKIDNLKKSETITENYAIQQEDPIDMGPRKDVKLLLENSKEEELKKKEENLAEESTTKKESHKNVEETTIFCENSSKIDNLKKNEEDPGVLEPRNKEEPQQGLKLVKETVNLFLEGEFKKKKEKLEVLEPRTKKGLRKTAKLPVPTEEIINLPRESSKKQDLKKKRKNCSLIVKEEVMQLRKRKVPPRIIEDMKQKKENCEEGNLKVLEPNKKHENVLKEETKIEDVTKKLPENCMVTRSRKNVELFAPSVKKIENLKQNASNLEDLKKGNEKLPETSAFEKDENLNVSNFEELREENARLHLNEPEELKEELPATHSEKIEDLIQNESNLEELWKENEKVSGIPAVNEEELNKIENQRTKNEDLPILNEEMNQNEELQSENNVNKIENLPQNEQILESEDLSEKPAVIEEFLIQEEVLQSDNSVVNKIENLPQNLENLKKKNEDLSEMPALIEELQGDASKKSKADLNKNQKEQISEDLRKENQDLAALNEEQHIDSKELENLAQNQETLEDLRAENEDLPALSEEMIQNEESQDKNDVNKIENLSQNEPILEDLRKEKEHLLEKPALIEEEQILVQGVNEIENLSQNEPILGDFGKEKDLEKPALIEEQQILGQHVNKIVNLSQNEPIIEDLGKEKEDLLEKPALIEEQQILVQGVNEIENLSQKEPILEDLGKEKGDLLEKPALIEERHVLVQAEDCGVKKIENLSQNEPILEDLRKEKEDLLEKPLIEEQQILDQGEDSGFSKIKPILEDLSKDKEDLLEIPDLIEEQEILVENEELQGVNSEKPATGVKKIVNPPESEPIVKDLRDENEDLLNEVNKIEKLPQTEHILEELRKENEDYLVLNEEHAIVSQNEELQGEDREKSAADINKIENLPQTQDILEEFRKENEDLQVSNEEQSIVTQNEELQGEDCEKSAVDFNKIENVAQNQSNLEDLKKKNELEMPALMEEQPILNQNKETSKKPTVDVNRLENLTFENLGKENEDLSESPTLIQNEELEGGNSKKLATSFNKIEKPSQNLQDLNQRNEDLLEMPALIEEQPILTQNKELQGETVVNKIENETILVDLRKENEDFSEMPILIEEQPILIQNEVVEKIENLTQNEDLISKKEILHASNNIESILIEDPDHKSQSQKESENAEEAIIDTPEKLRVIPTANVTPTINVVVASPKKIQKSKKSLKSKKKDPRRIDSVIEHLKNISQKKDVITNKKIQEEPMDLTKIIEDSVIIPTSVSEINETEEHLTSFNESEIIIQETVPNQILEDEEHTDKIITIEEEEEEILVEPQSYKIDELSFTNSVEETVDIRPGELIHNENESVFEKLTDFNNIPMDKATPSTSFAQQSEEVSENSSTFETTDNLIDVLYSNGALCSNTEVINASERTPNKSDFIYFRGSDHNYHSIGDPLLSGKCNESDHSSENSKEVPSPELEHVLVDLPYIPTLTENNLHQELSESPVDSSSDFQLLEQCLIARETSPTLPTNLYPTNLKQEVLDYEDNSSTDIEFTPQNSEVYINQTMSVENMTEFMNTLMAIQTLSNMMTPQPNRSEEIKESVQAVQNNCEVTTEVEETPQTVVDTHFVPMQESCPESQVEYSNISFVNEPVSFETDFTNFYYLPVAQETSVNTPCNKKVIVERIPQYTEQVESLKEDVVENVPEEPPITKVPKKQPDSVKITKAISPKNIDKVKTSESVTPATSTPINVGFVRTSSRTRVSAPRPKKPSERKTAETSEESGPETPKADNRVLKLKVREDLGINIQNQSQKIAPSKERSLCIIEDAKIEVSTRKSKPIDDVKASKPKEEESSSKIPEAKPFAIIPGASDVTIDNKPKRLQSNHSDMIDNVKRRKRKPVDYIERVDYSSIDKLLGYEHALLTGKFPPPSRTRQKKDEPEPVSPRPKKRKELEDKLKPSPKSTSISDSLPDPETPETNKSSIFEDSDDDLPLKKKSKPLAPDSMNDLFDRLVKEGNINTIKNTPKRTKTDLTDFNKSLLDASRPIFNLEPKKTDSVTPVKQIGVVNPIRRSSNVVRKEPPPTRNSYGVSEENRANQYYPYYSDRSRRSYPYSNRESSRSSHQGSSRMMEYQPHPREQRYSSSQRSSSSARSSRSSRHHSNSRSSTEQRNYNRYASSATTDLAWREDMKKKFPNMFKDEVYF